MDKKPKIGNTMLCGEHWLNSGSTFSLFNKIDEIKKDRAINVTEDKQGGNYSFCIEGSPRKMAKIVSELKKDKYQVMINKAITKMK